MGKHWDQTSQVISTNGDSGSLDVWNIGRLVDVAPRVDLDVSTPIAWRSARLRFDANLTAFAGTTPGIQFFIESHWGTGAWALVWQSPVYTTTQTILKFMGPGYDQTLPGPAVRVRRAITGSGGPSVTYTSSLSPA